MKKKTFLKAHWKNIVMVNYEIDPQILRSYLPAGVTIDTYQNQCFVSLVGFEFKGCKIAGIPIPYFGNFEEINLRFYVKRRDGAIEKRGVVFISELVPHTTVAVLANRLYKEHYTSCKIKYKYELAHAEKRLEYRWAINNGSYHIKAKFQNEESAIVPGTLEEFIYEHYYGFTKVTETETWEYTVNHPRWHINAPTEVEVQCDFGKIYGPDFSFLNQQEPYSVYNAVGSDVTIDWEINKIKV
ncbi:MAG: DUF2071 domain-containing protein [Bacteroidota bacterium]|nr:DUF2071 domain-containing protein [Bacteroidota bacterium]